MHFYLTDYYLQYAALIIRFAISDYDLIFTAQGGDYKAKRNRCCKLGVLRKFQRKNVLKILEYPSVNDSERKKRLHVV